MYKYMYMCTCMYSTWHMYMYIHVCILYMWSAAVTHKLHACVFCECILATVVLTAFSPYS